MSITDSGPAIGNVGANLGSEIGRGNDEGNAGGGDRGGVGDHIVIDPASVGAESGGDGGNGATGRRRGRPKGSRNTGAKSRPASQALDINGVSATLFSIHMSLAALTGAPEFQIDKDEAKMLAEASANVARHYDVGISQKTVDWTNLVGALGMIYGTRLFAVRARHARERSEKRAEAARGTAAEFAPNMQPGAESIAPGQFANGGFRTQ